MYCINIQRHSCLHPGHLQPDNVFLIKMSILTKMNQITADLPEHRNMFALLKNLALMLMIETSKNSLAYLAPGVEMVLLNILLKCQLPCG